MFNNLGKINYKIDSQKIEIDLNQINDGVNYTEEFIVFKKKMNCQFMIEFVITIVEN